MASKLHSGLVEATWHLCHPLRAKVRHRKKASPVETSLTTYIWWIYMEPLLPTRHFSRLSRTYQTLLQSGRSQLSPESPTHSKGWEQEKAWISESALTGYNNKPPSPKYIHMAKKYCKSLLLSRSCQVLVQLSGSQLEPEVPAKGKIQTWGWINLAESALISYIPRSTVQSIYVTRAMHSQLCKWSITLDG
jgi:hypothetical protein